MSAEALSFPPLMYGEEVPAEAINHACMKAMMGCDAGLVAYAAAQLGYSDGGNNRKRLEAVIERLDK